MSDITRRDVLRRIGLMLMATGVLDRVSAQEVHHLALAAQARDLAGWSAQRDGPAREGPSIILFKHAFLI